MNFSRPLSRRAFSGLMLVSVVSLFGCAQKEADTSPVGATTPSDSKMASPAATTGGAGGTLKVGLITPGKVSDKGWSESANTGVGKIKADLKAETSPPVEEPPVAQVEGVMQNMAQDGATLIFAHGSEYDSAAEKVAPKFPKTTITVMGGRAVGPNLMPIQFASGEATYLAGMLAGGMTKTGKVGLIGPTEIPIIKGAFASFERGAKAVRPDVKVTTTFIGSEDIAKGKQQAQALLDSGVDVIMHNANAAGQGVAQAVTEKDGAMFIGANADQSELATPKNLGSFVLDVPAAMEAVAKSVQSGQTGGKAYSAGIKDKAVLFKFNPGFKGTIPADLKAKIEKAQADIASGKLDPAK